MTLLQSDSDWAGAVFTASAMDEPFEDVTLTSTRDQFANIALQSAASVLYEYQQKLDSLTDVGKVAAMLVNAGKIVVHEYVDVTATGITVCLDAPLEDDESAYRAMTMVAEALDQLDGAHGLLTFGEPIKYTLKEVPGLLTRSPL